jgi:hypothetical protein
LVNVEDVRYPPTFGTLPNEIHGIVIEEFISASMVEEDAHDVFDFRASGSGQGQFPQPQLYLDRLYFVERAFTPFGDDPPP